MKVYRKRMEQIGKGEVVAGDVRGWWRITDIDINSGGSVVMTGINPTAHPNPGVVRQRTDIANTVHDGVQHGLSKRAGP